MKPTLFLALLSLSSAHMALGQTVIGTSSFFDPDFKVRRTGDSDTVNLIITNTPVSRTVTDANNSWTHSAGGHVQVRAELEPLGIPVANLDAQLAAYTRTVENSLVFGREITTTAQFLGGFIDVGDELQGLTNQLAGASVLYNWSSNATINNLAIVPDQLYRVDFSVTSGNGLPVNLLSSANFGITTAGVTGASNQSAQLLNLLNVIQFGSSAGTRDYSFEFKSNQPLSSLNFNFAATTGVGVSLLGGTANNQNVLTFSGFQVAAVPEPGTLVLCSSMVCLIALRRRRTIPGEISTPAGS